MVPMCSTPAPCHKFHSWIGVSLNSGSRGQFRPARFAVSVQKKKRMFSCRHISGDPQHSDIILNSSEGGFSSQMSTMEVDTSNSSSCHLLGTTLSSRGEVIPLKHRHPPASTEKSLFSSKGFAGYRRSSSLEVSQTTQFKSYHWWLQAKMETEHKHRSPLSEAG